MVNIIIENIIPENKRVSIPGTLFYIPKSREGNELGPINASLNDLRNNQLLSQIEGVFDYIEINLHDDKSLDKICGRGVGGKFGYWKLAHYIDYEKLKKINNSTDKKRIINNTIVLGDIISMYATAVANNATDDTKQIQNLYKITKEKILKGASLSPILIPASEVGEKDNSYPYTIADKLCYLSRNITDEKGNVIQPGKETIGTQSYKSILQKYQKQINPQTETQSM